MNTKMTISAALLLSAMATNASAIGQGGVNWTPDPVFPNTTMQFNFTQWFGAADAGPGSTPQIADNLAVPPADGSFLKGVGEVTSINALNSFIGSSGGPGGAGGFVPGGELTFAFGGLIVDSTQSGGFDLNAGWADFYVDLACGPSSCNVSPTTAPPPNPLQTAIDTATDGTPWLTFDIREFKLTAGNLIDGQASAVLKITGGTAASLFDPNAYIPWSGSFSAQANFAPGQTVSQGGSGSLTLNAVVPEPTTLSLLGVGLLGGLFINRKKKASA